MDSDDRGPNVVELQRRMDDATLVGRIREVLRELCDLMNEAEDRGIDVSFNIARASQGDPKSPWTVGSEKIVKNL